MDFLTLALIVVGIYSVLFFFDVFFKSCCHYPYLHLLESLGLSTSFYSIRWKTKALNRIIIKWGKSKPWFWKIWFNLGIIVSIIFLPVAFYILVSSLVKLFFYESSGEKPLVIITPVLPGINLPLSELGYYSLTLFICSIVHELGHALAAVVNDIGLLEMGCNLYLILPVAYITLPTEKLLALSQKKQLGIFTAGVWHNIFLSFVTYLLYLSLPKLFSPLYDYGNYISVSKITNDSPLKHSLKGLFKDDIIIGVNDCQIQVEDDWYGCLNDRKNLIPAVCISSNFINTLDESVPMKHVGSGYVECCDPKNNKNLCYEYIDEENNELELPGHVCLPGRKVMEQSNHFCTKHPHSCPNDLYCFRPILPNNTYLFKIQTKSRNIIYLGHPNDLFLTIEVSSYSKRTNFFSVAFANRVDKLLKYMTVVSLGLSFVNLLPFVFMDGEHILKTLGLIMFKKKISKGKVIHGIQFITWVLSFLLIMYLILSITFLI